MVEVSDGKVLMSLRQYYVLNLRTFEPIGVIVNNLKAQSEYWWMLRNAQLLGSYLNN